MSSSSTFTSASTSPASTPRGDNDDERDWLQFMNHLLAQQGHGGGGGLAPDDDDDDDDDEGCRGGLVLESMEYGDIATDTWVDVFPVIWRKARENHVLPSSADADADADADAEAGLVNTDACIVFLPSDDEHRLRFFGVGDPAPGREKVLRVNGGSHYFPAAAAPLSTDNESEGALELSSYYVFVDLRDPDTPILGVYQTDLTRFELTARRTQLMRDVPLSGEEPEQLILLSLLSFLDRAWPAPRVVELGGNVGRASVLLSTILAQHPDGQHVVFESSPTIADKLDSVRRANHASFHVVAGTLNDASRFSLAQSGWKVSVTEKEDSSSSVSPADVTTRPVAGAGPGCAAVRASYTYAETKAAYFGGQDANIWVVDCEGYFAHVLEVFPEILGPMQLLFLENDFNDAAQKRGVDERLRAAGLRCVLALPGGFPRSPSLFPSFLNFYEVWVRPDSELWTCVLDSVFDPRTAFVTSDMRHFQMQPATAAAAAASATQLLLPADLFPVVQLWAPPTSASAQDDGDHHLYEILSSPACARCTKLFDDMVASMEDLAPEQRAAFRVVKRDVVRAFATNRVGALTKLRDDHGFSLFDPSAPERPVSLPVVFYNGMYIGGATQAIAHLVRTSENENDSSV